MTDEYQLLIDGKWLRGKDMLEVKNKYSGRTIASIPSASREDLDAAVAAAQRAATTMADMPAHKRSEILSKAADLHPVALRGVCHDDRRGGGEGAEVRAGRGRPGRQHLHDRLRGGQTPARRDNSAGCRAIR